MTSQNQSACTAIDARAELNASDRAGSTGSPTVPARWDFLDATRAFALMLGVVFHASLSFVPMFIGWAVQDVSTSPAVLAFMTLSHSFRMELFFLVAGFLARSSVVRQGTGRFLGTRLLRLGVPFAVGWFLLHPLLISGWLMGNASLRGRVDIGAALRDAFGSLSTLPEGLWTRSHLWFLYYLLMITVAAAVLRAVFHRLPAVRDGILAKADAFTGWIAESRVSIPTLAAPTLGVLWLMDLWGVDTPDKSLRPHLPVLALYGGCYAVGWLFARQPERLGAMARITPARCFIALISALGVLALAPMEGQPNHPWIRLARGGFLACYALLLWSLVWLILGGFKKVCARPNRMLRYLADASYWIYLVHLPIVVWLQVAVAELPVHWSIKLITVVAATLCTAVLTYDLCVRSTWLGRLLTGKRQARALRWFRGHCGEPAGKGTCPGRPR